MAPATSQPRLCTPIIRKPAVHIMPAATPTSSPPSRADESPAPRGEGAPPRKKRRADRGGASRSTSPTPSQVCSRTPSASPPPRRRAPPLERLPRWLFEPRRHFVAAHGELPLPKRVAMGGKPFYDWDAWALALLAPELWRRRGPWQRLIASCAAAKPPHVDAESVPEVKAALVRIVVAEVVSQLVSRSSEDLTPEDRNWVTSVASRQRGRHARKPTLMLLFDLAFAAFDLAVFCLRNKDPSAKVLLREGNAKGAKDRKDDAVTKAIQQIIADSCDNEPQGDYVSERGAKRRRHADGALTIDPVILRVLQVVRNRDEKASDTLVVDNVSRVIDAIEKLLANIQAPRWHRRFTSRATAVKSGLMQAADIFSHRLPLDSLKAGSDSTVNEVLPEWLLLSLSRPRWGWWAEMANECNYVISTGAIPEEKARALACEYIVKALVYNSELSVTDSTVEQVVTAQLQYHDRHLTVKRIFDVALAFEQFYSFFVENHGNDKCTGNIAQWGVISFEGLVRFLAGLRDVLLWGSLRVRAMVSWSARSLDISRYYHEAAGANEQMSMDIETALQSAFAESSWDIQNRNVRSILPPSSSTPPISSGSDESNQASQMWLLNLDLNEPIFLAAAIVPWDPQRALTLLDRDIGLSGSLMQAIVEGKEDLPLWDFRRVAIFRVLLYKGTSIQYMRLLMERLQSLFDRRELHEGGNFSQQSISLLEAAVKEGNYCARTTLGLLLAGPGRYWDVARTWAQCEKSVTLGIQNLYISATAGDLEASTALSHIWASSQSVNGEEFRGVVPEQVIGLFRDAMQAQNAKAILNMGAIWRYGLPCLAPNEVVAVDAFLVALQGGIFGDARFVSAQHLLEIVKDAEEQGVADALAALSSKSLKGEMTTSSPYRIDDFCGLPQ